MVETLILAAGIPSAAVGFCFWFLEKKLEARAAAEKEERQRRQKHSMRERRNRNSCSSL